MVEGNPIPMVGISVSLLQPIRMCKIPTQKPEELVKCQNIDSIMFDGLKTRKREYISISSRPFTRSMDIVVTPAIIQHQRETPLVEVINDDEDIFPNREIAHDNEFNE